jgi:hypothetical protein
MVVSRSKKNKRYNIHDEGYGVAVMGICPIKIRKTQTPEEALDYHKIPRENFWFYCSRRRKPDSNYFQNNYNIDDWNSD